MTDETAIRLAAFDWIKQRGLFNEGVFDGTELNQGFDYQGWRITLKGQTGIWFPAGFSVPISIAISNQEVSNF